MVSRVVRERLLRYAPVIVVVALAWPSPAVAQASRPPSVPQVTPTSPVTLDLSAAGNLPRLRSLIVSWHGAIAGEYHAPRVRAAAPANIKSASKSIVSALVGIAIERGLIRGTREPIVNYFPELRQDTDRRKETITIEDLLTMRAGLESTSGRNYGRWVQSPNWVRFALTRKLVGEIGQDMEYSTGSSHLLSAILTKATHTSTWQFAQEVLARPLGFSLARWPQDPQGLYFGGNDMLLTPRQMLQVGELYLHRGAVGGRQIVPSAWVDTSCVPRTASVYDGSRRYGYGWWIQDFDDTSACFAWGYGGQYIMVFRELDLVVVATSSTAGGEERRGARADLFELVKARIVRPLRALASTR